MQRIAHLAHHTQAVGAVAGQDVGVYGQRRLELRQRQRRFKAQQLHAMAQHIQRSALVQLGAYPVQQGVGGLAAVVVGQRVPSFGLGGLHPGQQVCGEQGAGAVIACSVSLGVQLAVGCQVLANLQLEADFFMQAHGPPYRCQIPLSTVSMACHSWWPPGIRGLKSA